MEFIPGQLQCVGCHSLLPSQFSAKEKAEIRVQQVASTKKILGLLIKEVSNFRGFQAPRGKDRDRYRKHASRAKKWGLKQNPPIENATIQQRYEGTDADSTQYKIDVDTHFPDWPSRWDEVHWLASDESALEMPIPKAVRAKQIGTMLTIKSTQDGGVKGKPHHTFPVKNMPAYRDMARAGGDSSTVMHNTCVNGHWLRVYDGLPKRYKEDRCDHCWGWIRHNQPCAWCSECHPDKPWYCWMCLQRKREHQ